MPPRPSVLLSRRLTGTGVEVEFTTRNPMNILRNKRAVSMPSIPRIDLRSKRMPEAFGAVKVRTSSGSDPLGLLISPALGAVGLAPAPAAAPAPAPPPAPSLHRPDSAGDAPVMTPIATPKPGAASASASAQPLVPVATRSPTAESALSFASDTSSKSGSSWSMSRKSAFVAFSGPSPLSSAARASSSTLPTNTPVDEWVPSTDTVSGCEYWYNRTTGKTLWYNPTKPVWKRCEDPSSGLTYWFNLATRESSWTDPDLSSTASSASRKPPVSQGGGWKVFTTDTGLPYYWDPATGESCWELPPDFTG